MNKYEKLKRKEEIKEKCFKILHVVSYILSFCFVILMVIVGAQSCSKPQKVSAENDIHLNMNYKRNAYNYNSKDYPYSYVLKFSGTQTFSSDVLIAPYNIPSGVVSSTAGTIYKTYSFESNDIDCYCYFGTDFLKIKELNLQFRPKQYNSSNEIYYYQISYGFLTDYDNRLFNFFSADDSYYYIDLHINFVSGVKLFLSTDIIDDWIFKNWFTSYDSVSNLVFNKDWNYNAFLGTNLNGLYGSANFDSSGENMRYKNYNTGYFISNNQLYNQIQIWAIQSDGNSVYSVSQGTSGGIMPAPSGYWIYSFVYYRNTDNGNEILVNYHDTIPFTNGGASSRYYANTSTWVNDAFRYITFLEPLSDSLTIDLNAFNNNNQNSVSGYVGSGQITDVFSLVGSAFSAIIPILSIMVLPNITLGVLIFIPLVAMLVFAIIRIIKK